jgi:hypothetical protein
MIQLRTPHGAARLILVPVLATAAALVMVAPATAAPHVPAAPAMAAAHHASRHTLVPNLHVRRAPLFKSRIVGTLHRRGTRVSISCWAVGARVGRTRIWFYIRSPKRGFVTAAFISGPWPRVRRCPRTMRTHTARLAVWSRPSEHSRVRFRLGRQGTRVRADCWVLGQPIRGNRVWFHITRPGHGWIAAQHLVTGRRIGVAVC